MTGVINSHILTPMTKTQVYLQTEDLEALHRTSKRTGKSVAALIREAIHLVWLRPGTGPIGPVALWDGPIARSSTDHDAIYDEP